MMPPPPWKYLHVAYSAGDWELGRRNYMVTQSSPSAWDQKEVTTVVETWGVKISPTITSGAKPISGIMNPDNWIFGV